MLQVKCKIRFVFLCVFLVGGCFLGGAGDEGLSIFIGENKSNVTNTLGMDWLYGFGYKLGYVGPYIWRGLPITKGPSIQEEIWVSVKNFRLGMFMNMYGSNKDRKGWKLKKLTNLSIDTSKYSEGFGMINQVKFFLDWEHSFNETFTLFVGYTMYAYGNYTEVDTLKTIYEKKYGWFKNNSRYGEFSIKPSFKIGNLVLFTIQDFVFIAPERSFALEEWNEKKEILEWIEKEDTRRGSYHGIFGLSIEKRLSDELMCSFRIQEEIANRIFFETHYRDPLNGETISTYGAYQRNINFKTQYSPIPWVLISANCGAVFYTKETISNKTEAKGALLFGGLNTRLSF